MTSSKVHTSTGLSFGMKITLYILLVIILWLLIKYLEIRVAYRATFDWWSKYGGNKFPQVNIFNIYASYNSWIMYGISRLRGGPQNALNLQQIQFFINYIMKYTYWVDKGNVSRGTLLPAHVAKSAKIVFGQLPDFDEWYTRNNKTDTVWTLATPAGVYPDSLDMQGWKDKMAEWCDTTSDKLWVTDSQITVPDTSGSWAKAWQNVSAHPDNFLARTGVAPDSPLVVSFINGKYNDPNTGLELDAIAFQNLLGHDNINYGGWLGYLQGAWSDAVTADHLASFIYTSYSVKPNPPPKDCGGGAGGWLGAVGSALGGGIGIGAMGAMVENPMGGIALGIAGAVTAGVSLTAHGVQVTSCEHANEAIAKANRG